MYKAGFDCYLDYSQVLKVLSGYYQARIVLQTRLACFAVGVTASRSVQCPQCINAVKTKSASFHTLKVQDLHEPVAISRTLK